ncbi:methyltransferase [Mycobacterium sp. URHB0021]
MTAMILGYWVSQTIRAVADLSIADHLAVCDLTAADIAQLEGSAPDTTLRLMRAGVTLGLFTSGADGHYGGTPLLQTLRSDHPSTLRPMALSFTGREYWLPWNEFVTAIRQGSTRIQTALDTDLFGYYERHPAEAQEFSDAMRSLTTLWARPAADVIDTTGVKCAVDVGGANGSFLHLLQSRDPLLRGIVFDRPNIVEHAKAEIERTGRSDRTTVVGGDFFESVPSGDLYLLKFILHDWEDAECITILRRCREALAPGGRIAIIELIVDDHNPVSALFDMHMLAISTGRERTLNEYDTMLAAAGLRRSAVRDTTGPQSVIVATAV